jgi:hypothetical protein
VTYRPIQTRFRYDYTSFGLILPLRITRRLIMQKARSQAFSSKLEHSPPTGYWHMVLSSISLPSLGFFSPFPHGTSTLSVDGTYLALEGGPPRFTQPFTWAGLLGMPLDSIKISFTGLSPSMVDLSRSFYYLSGYHIEVPQPRKNKFYRFGLFPVRSPLLRESRLISCPEGTEMFHFPSFTSGSYVFTTR